MTERATPYALVFGDTGIAAEYFPAIRAAAPPRQRDAFFAVHEVNELLRAIAPDTGAAAAQIALLAYHAYHYWEAGEPSWSIAEAPLRRLLEQSPIGAWPLAPPAPAGYLQLPAHRLWVQNQAEQPAEALDGCFWVADAGEAGRMELLFVLGLQPTLGTFSVIELAGAPPPEGHWGDVAGRGEGEDFANVLPGGEHLLGLRTAGEALKLASRIFWWLQNDGSIRDRAGAGGDR